MMKRILQIAGVLLTLSTLTTADDLPLSRFPLYTRVIAYVGMCANSYSSVVSKSQGCPQQNPAACLCTDAKISANVASGIADCVAGLPFTDQTTATQLWASYCLTNAGVSARDETQFINIPLYTQVAKGGGVITYCVTGASQAFAVSFGCTDYTKAPCLCANTASSYKVASRITECVHGAGTSEEAILAASSIWDSYCKVNLETPAARTVGAPVTVAGTYLKNNFSTYEIDSDGLN